MALSRFRTRTAQTTSSSIKLPELPSSLRAQTPRFIRRMTRVFLVSLVVLPIALLGIPWQQNVRGEGRVIAYAPLERQQAIEAPIDGIVKEWFVAEGTIVKKGDPVVRMSDVDPDFFQRLEARYENARRERDAKEEATADYQDQITAMNKQSQFVAQAYDEQIAVARQKIKAAEQKIVAIQAEVALNTKITEVRQPLRDKGFTSEINYRKAVTNLEKSKADLESAKASLAGAKAELKSKQAERGEKLTEVDSKLSKVRAELNEARAELEKAKAELLKLESDVSRQEAQAVFAPFEGTVVRLLVNAGAEQVKAGHPIALIVPETQRLAVELYVDGNDYPWVEHGRKVRLQFEGWPVIQFGTGWPAQAVGTFGGVISLFDATADDSGRFRMLARPDPEDEGWPIAVSGGDSGSRLNFLRQGVQARGWILLEQVPLGFELWRQLNGFPPNIPQKTQQSKK